MRNAYDPAFLLTGTEFYESVDRYTPNLDDFHNCVAPLLPPGWTLHRNAIWFHCFHRGVLNSLRLQGWKLHLSIQHESALQLLERVVPELVNSGVSFKFAADRTILHLLNSKHWPRGGSGKFMAIYPPDDASFMKLAERLSSVTAEFRGPYILSDRRYRDSSVVHYRYGGFQRLTRLNNVGDRQLCIVAPDGTWVEDVREPYFQPPSWVSDPVPTNEREEDQYESNTLHGERFTIQEALIFSNAGGVYVGIDRENDRKVLIKEARPFVQLIGTSARATDMLAKEYRMLERVVNMDIAPHPIAHFVEWEHHFLVEEFIEGDTLANQWAATNILLQTNPSDEEQASFAAKYIRVGVALCNLINRLHCAGIVFGDLSPYNLMLNESNDKLTIIDFESASFTGEIDVPKLFTPGFGRPATYSRGKCFEDDYYAIGSMLAYMLFPFNTLFALDSSSIERIVPTLVRDAQFPDALTRLIIGLLSDDIARRPNLETTCEILRGLSVTPIKPIHSARSVNAIHPASEGKDGDNIENGRSTSKTLDRLIAFIKSSCDYTRTDRIVPADKNVFSTNPLGIAHGIAGVAQAIRLATGEIPVAMRDYLANVRATKSDLPPGLYSGLAGVSWVLWDCGLHESALACISESLTHQLSFDDPYYENGISGQGIAALYLYSKSAEPSILEFATNAGKYLIKSAQWSAAGCRWVAEHEDYCLGNGASGVALFLLYLYCATGDSEFLRTGEGGLSYDLAHATPIRGDAISWSRKKSDNGIVYPYWMHGSAGVGAVLIRYLRIMSSRSFESALPQITRDVARKYAVFPGMFTGLSGLGHMLLDCRDVLGDRSCASLAARVAAGIDLHVFERGEGLAVLGNGSGRISCDYATGSAGVVTFLLRLTKPGGTPFFPDELLMAQPVPSSVNVMPQYERAEP